MPTHRFGQDDLGSIRCQTPDGREIVVDALEADFIREKIREQHAEDEHQRLIEWARYIDTLLGLEPGTTPLREAFRFFWTVIEAAKALVEEEKKRLGPAVSSLIGTAAAPTPEVSANGSVAAGSPTLIGSTPTAS